MWSPDFQNYKPVGIPDSDELGWLAIQGLESIIKLWLPALIASE